MKKFAILGIALALTACGATVEEQEHDLQSVQASLPDGCTVNYAGSVRIEGEHRASRVFYVKCGTTITTSETHTQSEGKTSHEESNVTINDAALVGVLGQM